MLKVLKPGFFTTVQDEGRFGFRNKGVPISGAMDDVSASRVNTLLENGAMAAVMEITMTGPSLQFEKSTYICVAGALLSATLNDNAVANCRVVQVKEGDILSFGKLKKGFRAYLGVKGGFKTEKVLGSRSYYHPVTKQRCLAQHETVPYEETTDFSPKISEAKFDGHLDEDSLYVHKGPEFDLLTDEQMNQIFSSAFSIAKENDRMAYQLAETIEQHNISMLTSATLQGTVQLTPSGRLIILMKDGQTTGGYPRILQLTKKSMAVLAQKRFGDPVHFESV
ncbi:biotin-dependent carboxyltransferase family protein [Allomuricauda sp. SCSIO 65647]|uniref:5-oxoprolinase subunit C family protein n=1 Tax=Allomuricauda sp. SCSIO 65647 TaxID=2908843 RepID=UPI001F45FFD7|nr:biotin-dependent carboxyltransferase family protein [Muricauda sp. SCSIO 65647]UJH67490.1 biotin-dependent carboxyltransferase family protein [Muricauda sp. SCSIO 65647]